MIRRLLDARLATRPAAATASVAPLTPVHLRWQALAAGDARVTWIRRSRVGWRWADGEVPLGEERECYRVAVTSALGTRVFLVDQPLASITRDEVAGGIASTIDALLSEPARAAAVPRGNRRRRRRRSRLPRISGPNAATCLRCRCASRS